MTFFGTRPKWTYVDPERYGYPPDSLSLPAASGVVVRVCPECKRSAWEGESIKHDSGCGRSKGQRDAR